MNVSTPLNRYWQLGLLAKDLAAARLPWPGRDVAETRQRLVARLGRLHGLPQKVGQLLALAELGGPSDFAPLTEAESRFALPAAEALALLEDALGRPWTESFRSIDPVGIAASLGQVHRAVLLDGRDVALKIQYPDGAAHVDADLGALDGLSLPFGGLRGGFDLAEYRRTVGDMLRRELDYRQEADALRRFGGFAADCDWLVVPEVIDSLSADRVLTMTWLDGAPLDAVRQWPEADRRHAAEALLRLFLTSCFHWRYLHADPHPGNYRYERTARGVRVVLLDFGCVLTLDECRVEALAGLIEAARQAPAAAADPVLAGYVSLGFNPDLLQPMAHLLPALNALLFEPLATDSAYALAGWRLSERVERLLGPFRWNFRCAAPAEFVLLVRAYLGLLRTQHALDAPINWSEVWRSSVGRQNPTPFAPPPRAERPKKSGDRPIRSRYLKVAVWENGQTRVSLTFNAIVAECLPDLIPPDVEEKLNDRQLDVYQIAAEAAAREFAPGELFRLTEGSKLFRVWLEE